jgi:SAM-dependent methyltransferase
MSTQPTQNEQLRDYWETYYAAQGIPRVPVPSQFAIFVQGELSSPVFVVDIGCGMGRDALYFASNGHSVVGVDAATAAVKRCTAAAQALRLSAQFVASSVGDASLHQRLSALRDGARAALIYARFFLHAVDEATEAEFLALAASLSRTGDLLALEFRTIRDRALEKVTCSHYRRFIEPAALLSRAYQKGYVSEYFVEGFGFAKYKTDDAYVARCLLRMP